MRTESLPGRLPRQECVDLRASHIGRRCKPNEAGPVAGAEQHLLRIRQLRAPEKEEVQTVRAGGERDDAVRGARSGRTPAQRSCSCRTRARRPWAGACAWPSVRRGSGCDPGHELADESLELALGGCGCCRSLRPGFHVGSGCGTAASREQRGLLQVELPGHAKAVVDPAEFPAEAIIRSGHQRGSFLRERGRTFESNSASLSAFRVQGHRRW